MLDVHHVPEGCLGLSHTCTSQRITDTKATLYMQCKPVFVQRFAGSAPQDDPLAANSVCVVHTTLGEVLRSRLQPGTLPNGRIMMVQLPPATPPGTEKQQQHQQQQHARIAAHAPVSVPTETAVPTSQHA